MPRSARVSEQYYAADGPVNGADTNNHALFTALAKAVKKNIEAKVPGLKLEFAGKSTQGYRILASLIGQVPIDNESSTKDVDASVRGVMQELRTPSKLLREIADNL